MADIVETAIKAGSFNTLVTAVKAAGLVDTLKGNGPFTVFAPTDEAFNHVVSGKVMAADVSKMKTAKTVEGSDLKIDASHGVKINNSTVTTADVAADNGVIHIIDTVLMPA
jgi:uncharacterized surface protein with fasciclin (FAS1) repeats